MVGDSEGRYRIGFLLVPEFSMIAFTSAVEVVRLTNRVMRQPAYAWSTLSADGERVTASNGIELHADGRIMETSEFDAVVVCAGLHVQDHEERSVLAWLRRRSAHGAAVGALCTGTHILARAGLLNGYSCTIHWENIPAFVEAFPDIDITSDLFAIDRNRFTCAGGTAALDMMLNLVSQHHGAETAAAVSDELIHHRIRDPGEGQRMDLRSRSGIAHPKLLAVMATMEENIENPLNCGELATRVGLSTRQLERLFRTYLATPPTRYYLKMRLERARFLLRQTSLPIFDVALAAGFVSASHFSKCYREYFGAPPSGERRRQPAEQPQPSEQDADIAAQA